MQESVTHPSSTTKVQELRPQPSFASDSGLQAPSSDTVVHEQELPQAQNSGPQYSTFCPRGPNPSPGLSHHGSGSQPPFRGSGPSCPFLDLGMEDPTPPRSLLRPHFCLESVIVSHISPERQPSAIHSDPAVRRPCLPLCPGFHPSFGNDPGSLLPALPNHPFQVPLW